MATDRFEKVLDAERLGETTHTKRVHLGALVPAGGEHHGGGPSGKVAHAAHHGRSVESGHGVVEHDQSEFVGAHQVERRFTIGGFEAVVSFTLEDAPQRAPKPRIIIDHEDRWRG